MIRTLSCDVPVDFIKSKKYTAVEYKKKNRNIIS